MWKTVAVLLGTVALVSGCGSSGGTGQTPDAQLRRLGDTDFLPLGDTSGLRFGTASIAGTGRLLAKNSVLAGQSNFPIDFTLEPSGTLTLKAFAQTTLEGAVDITFGRGAGDLLTVNVNDGTRNRVLTDRFGGALANGPVRAEIDVHQENEHRHIIIWLAGLPGRVDSGYDRSGTGNYWGITLQKAAFTAARNIRARAPH